MAKPAIEILEIIDTYIEEKNHLPEKCGRIDNHDVRKRTTEFLFYCLIYFLGIAILLVFNGKNLLNAKTNERYLGKAWWKRKVTQQKVKICGTSLQNKSKKNK